MLLSSVPILAPSVVEDLAVLRRPRTASWSRTRGCRRRSPSSSRRRSRPSAEQAETGEDDHQAELLDPAGLGLARGVASGSGAAGSGAGACRAPPGTGCGNPGGDALAQRAESVAASASRSRPLGARSRRARRAPDGRAASREAVERRGRAPGQAALLRLLLEHGLEVGTPRRVEDAAPARPGGAAAGLAGEVRPSPGVGGPAGAVVRVGSESSPSPPASRRRGSSQSSPPARPSAGSGPAAASRAKGGVGRRRLVIASRRLGGARRSAKPPAAWRASARAAPPEPFAAPLPPRRPRLPRLVAVAAARSRRPLAAPPAAFPGLVPVLVGLPRAVVVRARSIGPGLRRSRNRNLSVMSLGDP